MKIDDKLIALALVCTNIITIMGVVGIAYIVYHMLDPVALTTQTIGWLLLWLFIAFVYYMFKTALHMQKLDDE